MSSPTHTTLLTEAEQLDALVASLAEEKLISVDTESNGLHAFREQVCLIQFSTAQDDYLVDPLAIEDLSPLAKIFSNPEIEKIFHASEYDLIVLQRDFGWKFANLFDTMIAARILGKKKVGLGGLIEAELGIKLAKRFQKADWGKRPIPADMLDYARLDTHYLIQLRRKLKDELKEGGRWPMAEEDFARLPKAISTPTPTADADIWRVKGARDLQPQQRAILSKLVDYRRARAEKADVPLFKIIGDRTLSAIAAAEPRGIAQLEQIEGMSTGQIRRHGRALLDAVKEGASAEPIQRPRRGNYDEDFADRVETLRNWRKLAARKMEVESDVILPRDLMEKIARENPGNMQALNALLSDLPWRRAEYGEEIFETLNPS
jgi:ribonuclease D